MSISPPDESTLRGSNYRQELRRVLKPFAVFAVAFSIVSITTGNLQSGFQSQHFTAPTLPS